MRPQESSENPLHTALNAAGIPWQLPRASLVQRYGIRPHAAYQSDVIELDTPRPFLNGLLWPLSTLEFPQFSPRMPATHFSGTVFQTWNTRDNLRFAAKQLIPILGKPENCDTSNTLRLCWQFGCASLSLTVWPPDLESFPTNNPAHERDPRLKYACRVQIETGFRQPTTDEEITWLKSFKPITRFQTGRFTAASALSRPAWPNELEFVRYPDPAFSDVFGHIGCSADRATLIFFSEQLYLIPLESVISIYVGRVLRAKGPGGSYLEIRCRTDIETYPEKALKVTSAPGPEDLNDLASRLSTELGKPFKLGDYEEDI